MKRPAQPPRALRGPRAAGTGGGDRGGAGPGPRLQGGGTEGARPAPGPRGRIAVAPRVRAGHPQPQHRGAARLHRRPRPGSPRALTGRGRAGGAARQRGSGLGPAPPVPESPALGTRSPRPAPSERRGQRQSPAEPPGQGGRTRVSARSPRCGDCSRTPSSLPPSRTQPGGAGPPSSEGGRPGAPHTRHSEGPGAALGGRSRTHSQQPAPGTDLCQRNSLLCKERGGVAIMPTASRPATSLTLGTISTSTFDSFCTGQ